MNVIGNQGSYPIPSFKFSPGITDVDGVNGKGAVKSLSDYQRKITEINREKGSKSHRSTQTFNNLVLLGKVLSEEYGKTIDPIKYFIQLYYGEGLSISDIITRVNGLHFLYKDESGLRKLFKLTFLWELRETNERTPIRDRKINRKKRKDSEKINEFNRKKQEENGIKLLKWFIENLNIPFPNFDINYYNALENKRLKTLYLFENYYGIEKDSFGELVGIGVGSRAIAGFLNEKLNDIFKKLGIEGFSLTSSEVERLLNKDL